VILDKHKKNFKRIKTKSHLMTGFALKEPLLTQIYLTVQGMTCNSCITSIKNVIANNLGPKASVDVNLLTGRVIIKTEKPVPNPQEIVKAIEDAGFTCSLGATKVKKGEPNISELRLWFRRLLICGIFGILEFSYSMIFKKNLLIKEQQHHASFLRQSSYIEALLVTPLQWTIGWLFAKKAIQNLKLGVCTMDLLISIASFVCYAASILDMIFFQNGEWMYFEASSTLLLFATIGKFLECYTKEKTKSQINNLCQGMENCITATLVLGNGEERKVPTSLLKVGDLVIVKKGEYFPADGVVIKGETTADESLITGESKPVTKIPGNSLFAGSINGQGVIKMKVEQEFSNSTIAQVIQLVQSTCQKKPKVQNIADKIAGIFIPIVLLLSFMVLGFWVSMAFMGIVPSYSLAFKYAISVLTIACPCALGLAIPTAIFVGKGVAARHGILIKDEARLFDVIASNNLLFMFDKTGTLTKGKLSVHKMVFCGVDLTHKQLLTSLLLLEKQSGHIISQVLIDYCINQGISCPDSEIKNYAEKPGRGIEGTVDRIGHFLIGNKQYLMEHLINLPPIILEQAHAYEELGMMVVFVSCEAQPICYFVLSDSIKDDAISGIAKLKTLSPEVNMLTGDQWTAARWIGEQLGINKVYASASPSGKAEIIREKQAFPNLNKIIFIGDGINDGPALAQANLGIAIGMNSSHLAQTAASVILLNSQLWGLYNALNLAKKIRRSVLMGFWWATIYNLISIPLAAGAFHFWGIGISPEISSLLMAFSSVSVIINALLLYRWKPSKKPTLDEQINLII
jgi:P-type Cu+ transporter